MSKGQNKNINCEYKIINKSQNENENNKIYKDEDILYEDMNNVSYKNFMELINIINFSILSLTNINQINNKSISSQDNYFKDNEYNSYGIINLLKIIGNHNNCANYIKELSNGLIVSGGTNNLIFYDRLKYNIIYKIIINNDNIYELISENKNIFKLIICSNEINRILSINNTYNYFFKDIKQKVRICLKYNDLFFISNKNGLFLINNFLSKVIDSTQLLIANGLFYNGIK